MKFILEQPLSTDSEDHRIAHAAAVAGEILARPSNIVKLSRIVILLIDISLQ